MPATRKRSISTTTSTARGSIPRTPIQSISSASRRKARVGVFATQLGLIARYGMDYPDVPYLVKLNSKSNLIKTAQADPRSSQWLELQQVIEFQESSGLEYFGRGLHHLSGERA